LKVRSYVCVRVRLKARNCLEHIIGKASNSSTRYERIEKSIGVVVCQDTKSKEEPSISQARHADNNEHGTAQDGLLRMDEHLSDIPHQLRFSFES
jgi:hypothetical protein